MNEYHDAVYEPIDQRGYVTLYPCLILGVIGPYLHILIWDRHLNDYSERVVKPQTITFEDPTHKTELLDLIASVQCVTVQN